MNFFSILNYRKLLFFNATATIALLILAHIFIAQAQTFPLYMNLETGHLFTSQAQAKMESAMIKQWRIQSFSQMILDDMILKEGKRKMAAGLTSNKFTPLAKNSSLSKLIPPEASAAEKQQMLAVNEMSLNGFNKLMKQLGLTVNDLADARALAFSLAFYAARGEDAGDKRLRWLRNQYGEAMSKDVAFQGYPDSWRQEQYERMAVSAVNAVGARRKSEQADLSEEQRAVYLETAREAGDKILSGLWTKPSEAIEMTENGFEDRGVLAVESGSGQTTFKSTSETNIAQIFAAEPLNRVYNWNESYWAALLPRFNTSVKNMGLNTNDIADANVAAATIVYPIFADGKTLNAKQIAWLRAEMRKDILGSADFQRFTDAQKQNFYETLALKTMHIVAQNEIHLQKVNSAKNQSSDDFMAQAVVSAANSLTADDKTNAYELLKSIFAPRNFDDYVLTQEGFQKIR